MGSDHHPDEQLRNVGSVALNRVADERFPDTLREVIYQPGQYAPAISGAIETAQPTERCYIIAEELLESGSVLPSKVIWQAEFPQGTEIVEIYTDAVLGTTTYYCR